MAQDRNITFKARLEYAAAKAAAFVFRVLPLPLAVRLGRILGWAFFTFDKRHRNRVKEQVSDAFGEELSEPEALDVARKMYRHLGEMLAEFVRIPALNANNLDEHVNWNNHIAELESIMAEGKGLIMATGHLGHWEIGGACLSLKGFSQGAIARPLDNPLIDDYVRSIRESCGNHIWDKFGALRKVVRVIDDKKGFGILVDQDAGQRGVFAPFFGIQASTIPTVADLAVRTGAPIVCAAMHRSGIPMKFEYHMLPPILVDTNADKETERLRILTKINEDMEALIRIEPSQWLWVHRRWKTRPNDEATKT